MVVNGVRQGDGFLCATSEADDVLRAAETRKAALLEELKTFFNCNVDIRFDPVRHAEGVSIVSVLTFQGKDVVKYASPEICFCELETMMFQKLLNERSGE